MEPELRDVSTTMNVCDQERSLDYSFNSKEESEFLLQKRCSLNHRETNEFFWLLPGLPETDSII